MSNRGQIKQGTITILHNTLSKKEEKKQLTELHRRLRLQNLEKQLVLKTLKRAAELIKSAKDLDCFTKSIINKLLEDKIQYYEQSLITEYQEVNRGKVFK